MRTSSSEHYVLSSPAQKGHTLHNCVELCRTGERTDDDDDDDDQRWKQFIADIFKYDQFLGYIISHFRCCSAVFHCVSETDGRCKLPRRTHTHPPAPGVVEVNRYRFDCTGPNRWIGPAASGKKAHYLPWFMIRCSLSDWIIDWSAATRTRGMVSYTGIGGKERKDTGERERNSKLWCWGYGKGRL